MFFKSILPKNGFILNYRLIIQVGLEADFPSRIEEICRERWRQELSSCGENSSNESKVTFFSTVMYSSFEVSDRGWGGGPFFGGTNLKRLQNQKINQKLKKLKLNHLSKRQTKLKMFQILSLQRSHREVKVKLRKCLGQRHVGRVHERCKAGPWHHPSGETEP